MQVSAHPLTHELRFTHVASGTRIGWALSGGRGRAGVAAHGALNDTRGLRPAVTPFAAVHRTGGASTKSGALRRSWLWSVNG